MPTRVQLADGRVVTVQTDDPQEAARAAHRFQQANPVSAEHPAWRPRNVSDRVRGAPSDAYQAAYERRARERSPPPNASPAVRQAQELNRSGPAGLTNQMMRNLDWQDDVAGFSTYLGQGTDNLIRRVRGQPIEIPAGEAANAAIDYERAERDRVAREQPIMNAVSIGMSVPASAGTPAGVIPRMTMLGAGTATAGINVPFALARQEGSLQERLPGAGLETAVAFGAGAGLQGLVNRLTRPTVSNTTASRIQDFDAAGVRAPLAAVQGRGSAPMAMAISENPIGGNVRRNLQNSVDDVQRASQRLTQQVGTPEPRDTAGEIIQAGVRRFASQRVPRPAGNVDPRSVPVSELSVSTKADLLYDNVFARLRADEAAMVGQVDGPLLNLDRTRQVLASIQNRVSGEASNRAMRSQMIDEMAEAIDDDMANGTLRFQDLREWRTRIREAQRNEGLRQGMDNAALQRIEGALTGDIYDSAVNISPGVAHELRRADQWYRTANARIENALERFMPSPTNPGASAYRHAITLAQQGGGKNARALRQVRASLRPDEWRAFGATVADELGNPSFGNPTVLEPGAFSIENFVTNYARLSPEGRQLLFGKVTPELDRLARVAGNIKNVRGFANMSRSSQSVQNTGTLMLAGGATASAVGGNMIPLAGLISTGLAMRITGEMLTNPAFVRWLTSTGAAGGQGMRRQLAMLATIAARDPAIVPLYKELVQRGYAQVQLEFGQGAPRSDLPQRSVERELQQ